jgi:hypothetical protein
MAQDRPALTDHQWRDLASEEAYPATSGRVCQRCGIVDLGWCGYAPEEMPGLMMALGMEMVPLPPCKSDDD